MMTIYTGNQSKIALKGSCCPICKSNFAPGSPGWLTEIRACLGDLKEQNIICTFSPEKMPLRLSLISKLAYLLGSYSNNCLTLYNR